MEIKKHSPAFQFYPQDFLVGCADMSAEEVGGYIRLLCYQWTKGSLPNNNKKLMQMSGVFTVQELDSIKQKFKCNEQGNLVNLKMESVRYAQDEYREKQRVKANKRWESQGNATALQEDIPQAMPNECPSSSTSSLSLTTISSSKKTNTEKSNRFIPPSLQELDDYCFERMNGINPQQFLDHYISNGWMVGKNKMKDWKSAVRNWERRKKEFNTTKNGKSNNNDGSALIDWVNGN